MGRPRTSEPRNQQLNLSLTQGELENIQRRASALGMRPVHFARAALIDPGNKVAVTRAPSSHVDRLVYAEISRLGNNLNQLVRHLHRTGDPLPADLEPLLKDIRQIIERRVPG
jgi:hypothetical protein